jgi:hypothetical protein
MDNPQAIEPHRCEGFANGEGPHFRVLGRRLIEDVTNAEFVTQASDKAEGVQDLAAGDRGLWHRNLL